MTDEEDYSSVDILADYECPECGRMDEPLRGYAYTEDEANEILGGDEHGYVVCPECNEELQQTAEAATEHLAWLTEKLSKLPTPTTGGTPHAHED